MNIPLNREFLSQLIIALAVCVGGWMMFVSSKAEQVHALQQQIADYEAMPEAISEASFRTLADRVSSMKSKLEVIAEKSAVSSDSSLLYARVMDLAKRHNVEVQRLSPDTDKSQKDESTRRVSRLQLSVTGEYEHIAAFLGGFDQLGGFIRTESLSISPASSQGESVLQASLSCSAMGFDVSSVATKLQEDPNVDD